MSLVHLDLRLVCNGAGHSQSFRSYLPTSDVGEDSIIVTDVKCVLCCACMHVQTGTIQVLLICSLAVWDCCGVLLVFATNDVTWFRIAMASVVYCSLACRQLATRPDVHKEWNHFANKRAEPNRDDPIDDAAPRAAGACLCWFLWKFLQQVLLLPFTATQTFRHSIAYGFIQSRTETWRTGSCEWFVGQELQPDVDDDDAHDLSSFCLRLCNAALQALRRCGISWLRCVVVCIGNMCTAFTVLVAFIVAFVNPGCLYAFDSFEKAHQDAVVKAVTENVASIILRVALGFDQGWTSPTGVNIAISVVFIIYSFFSIRRKIQQAPPRTPGSQYRRRQDAHAEVEMEADV